MVTRRLFSLLLLFSLCESMVRAATLEAYPKGLGLVRAMPMVPRPGSSPDQFLAALGFTHPPLASAPDVSSTSFAHQIGILNVERLGLQPNDPELKAKVIEKLNLMAKTHTIPYPLHSNFGNSPWLTQRLQPALSTQAILINRMKQFKSSIVVVNPLATTLVKQSGLTYYNPGYNFHNPVNIKLLPLPSAPVVTSMTFNGVDHDTANNQIFTGDIVELKGQNLGTMNCQGGPISTTVYITFPELGGTRTIPLVIDSYSSANDDLLATVPVIPTMIGWEYAWLTVSNGVSVTGNGTTLGSNLASGLSDLNGYAFDTKAPLATVGETISGGLSGPTTKISYVGGLQFACMFAIVSNQVQGNGSPSTHVSQGWTLSSAPPAFNIPEGGGNASDLQVNQTDPFWLSGNCSTASGGERVSNDAWALIGIGGGNGQDAFLLPQIKSGWQAVASMYYADDEGGNYEGNPWTATNGYSGILPDWGWNLSSLPPGATVVGPSGDDTGSLQNFFGFGASLSAPPGSPDGPYQQFNLLAQDVYGKKYLTFPGPIEPQQSVVTVNWSYGPSNGVAYCVMLSLWGPIGSSWQDDGQPLGCSWSTLEATVVTGGNGSLQPFDGVTAPSWSLVGN